MAEKDITEKILFDKNDVFADIINVLVFGGEEMIDPKDLIPSGQRSQLKIANQIHEQERDVAKIWVKNNMRFALWGSENQTCVERDMVMRTMSYDGSSYKEQVIHNKLKDVVKWDPYPAITLVLYFGQQHWTGPRTLKELLKPLHPKIDALVSDYRLNIFEISYLDPATVAMFKSDFRIVADYFVQMRINKTYKPEKETIRHVDATLKLMSALTGDSRFESHVNEIIKRKGDSVTMCDVLTEAENQGVKKSICAVADLVPLDTLVQRFELPKEEILKILHEAGIPPLL